nr:hypothetical protein CFP56_31248 [Quercus suber]
MEEVPSSQQDHEENDKKVASRNSTYLYVSLFTSLRYDMKLGRRKKMSLKQIVGACACLRTSRSHVGMGELGKKDLIDIKSRVEE